MSIFSGIPDSPDNKAIREFRDELKDLNQNLKAAVKSSNRVQKIVLVLACIQILIAIFQLAFSALEYKWLGVIVMLIFSGIFIWIILKFKEIDN